MTEITIDKKVRFGKPVLKGTKLTVDEVTGALAGGMSFEEIEREYKIKKSRYTRSLEVCNKDTGRREGW